MLTVHHLNDSRSQRVLWLLEELEVPYEIVRHQRNPETMLAPPELKAVHPLGKAPVIVDDGRTVAETGAILEHIARRHGGERLRPPPGADAGDRVTYWLHYAEGSAMPPLLLKLIFSVMPKRAPALVRPIVAQIAAKAQSTIVDPQLKTHIAFWEAELGRDAWFAGPEFTLADIMMSFPVEAAASRAPFGPEHRRLRAFLNTIHGRPAYRRALERGGAYSYARA